MLEKVKSKKLKVKRILYLLPFYLCLFTSLALAQQPSAKNYAPMRQGDGNVFYDQRTEISFYANAQAAGATGVETIITLNKSAGTGATSSATTFVITSGKKFRIKAISVATRGHATATAQTTTFNLRINTAGACTTSSTPILMAFQSATPATSLAWDRVIVPVADGYEILGDGTLQFCVSAAATYVTNAPTWSVNIIGSEY